AVREHRLTQRVDRLGGKRQHWFLCLDVAGPYDGDMLAGELHYDGSRAFVLARERGTRWVELHAVALNRAARRDVDVERCLANGLRIEAAVLGLRDRQHVVQQYPGLVETH